MLAAPIGALGVRDDIDPSVFDDIVLIGGVNDDIMQCEVVNLEKH